MQFSFRSLLGSKAESTASIVSSWSSVKPLSRKRASRWIGETQNSQKTAEISTVSFICFGISCGLYVGTELRVLPTQRGESITERSLSLGTLRRPSISERRHRRHRRHRPEAWQSVVFGGLSLSCPVPTGLGLLPWKGGLSQLQMHDSTRFNSQNHMLYRGPHFILGARKIGWPNSQDQPQFSQLS